MVQEFGLRRLLLAVEEPATRALIRRILRPWPADIVDAPTLAEALRWARDWRPEIMLLDEAWEPDIKPSAYRGMAVAVLTFDLFSTSRRVDSFVERIVQPFTPDALTSSLAQIYRRRRV